MHILFAPFSQAAKKKWSHLSCTPAQNSTLHVTALQVLMTIIIILIGDKNYEVIEVLMINIMIIGQWSKDLITQHLNQSYTITPGSVYHYQLYPLLFFDDDNIDVIDDH